LAKVSQRLFAQSSQASGVSFFDSAGGLHARSLPLQIVDGPLLDVVEQLVRRGVSDGPAAIDAKEIAERH